MNPLPRDEHVLEKRQRLDTGKTRRDGRRHLALHARRRTACDHGNAGRIGRDGKRHRVVCIFGAHVARRQHDQFVRIGRQRVVGLGAAHHDSVCAPLDHVEIEIRVRLLMRA
jgi:hypothetical protein